MIKKGMFIGIAAFLISAMGEAALPPLAQSLAELKELVNHDNLPHLLSMAEPILSIERNDKGYLIKTDRNALQVNIHYLESHIGPAKFEFEFKKPISLKSK